MKTQVMIADDSRLLRSMIRDILSLDERIAIAGEAVNGREALELYKTLKPQIVLMDIVMPEMDGIESLKSILAVDPSARVIMISNPGQEGLVMESVVAGARKFLIKPLNPEALIKAIQTVAEEPELKPSA